MQITRVGYAALFNLGNYSNERIALSAKLEEGDTPAEAIEKLRLQVIELAGVPGEELKSTIYRKRNELRELERKTAEARSNWDAMAEFLRAQGIKPDAPSMPMFKNLLPEVKEEESVIDGELEDDEAEDTSF